MVEGNLSVWGVDAPKSKARQLMADLIAMGWQLDPNREQRPHPPTANEMCPLHPGCHAQNCRGCRADQLAGTESPARASGRRGDYTAGVKLARSQMEDQR
jgi:hypothetical protein